MAFSLQGFIDNSLPTIKAAWLNAVDKMYALGQRTNAGTPITLANSQWQVTDATNNYSSMDINNQSSGILASSDVVMTADTGTDTTNYVNIGINCSGYSQAGWTVNGALDGYVYASNGNMAIGTASAKRLDFFVGGTLTANVAMTISSAGIASLTTAPTGTDSTTKIATTSFCVPKGLFTTAGDILYATGSGAVARLPIGTANQVLQVNGGATAPQWSSTGTGITLSTPTATTSGTSIDFTSLPAGIKRVTINLKQVSSTGTSPFAIQIGPTGGIESSGYDSQAGTRVSESGAITTAFQIQLASVAAGNYNGTITLILENSSNNTWVEAGVVSAGADRPHFSAGSKSIAGALSRVRLTTIGGTDTFDNGEVNITYE